VSREKSRRARERRSAPVTGPADDDEGTPSGDTPEGPREESRGPGTPAVDPETDAVLRERLLGPG
jgi:hypothetical protein